MAHPVMRLAFVNGIPLCPHRKSRLNHCHRPSITCSVPLIIGVNQYSHDTSVALIHADTGTLLFAQSKERLSRQKHHAGDIADLIPHALNAVASDDETLFEVAAKVRMVVVNNHHFRVLPFEHNIPFQVSQAYVPHSYLSPWNLIASPVPYLHPSERYAPHATKFELSHHLAHAYSAVFSCPFDHGLVVIMDGMGDARDDWLVARSSGDKTHFSELNLPQFVQDSPNFVEYPTDFATRPGVAFREAETVYIFDRCESHVRFSRVYKRWTPENAPSELPNHSFEQMDSVGAMYSRVSAIIFKDWNNCGKVMGLAPYGQSSKKDTNRSRYFIDGQLWDGTIDMNNGKTKGLEHIQKAFSDCDDNIGGKELRVHFEQLANAIQQDLESIATEFISKLIAHTGERNLVFAGGVALNSTLNGVLHSLEDVDRLYIPPYPGDEGIAIGCAYFGLSLMSDTAGRPLRRFPQKFTPLLGKNYSQEEVMEAVRAYSPWLHARRADSATEAAKALASSFVVAWFSGKSEFGPRALGSRSILADPRDQKMITRLNSVVKRRESFRPFAPSVISDFATQWFENCDRDSSPFMSLTKRSKRPQSIPAAVHIDGTSRLQTLSEEHNPEYYRLISHFHTKTGIPMILNTSFNTAGEPIVESPADAIKCFLNSDGIDYLFFPGIVVRKRDFTLVTTEETKLESNCASFRSEQIQDSHGHCLRTTITVMRKAREDKYLFDGPRNWEESVELVDGLQLEILETIQRHGTCTVAVVIEELCENSPNTAIEDPENYSGDDICSRIVDLLRKQLIYNTEDVRHNVDLQLGDRSGSYS